MKNRIRAAVLCLLGKPVMFNVWFVDFKVTTRSAGLVCVGLRFEGGCDITIKEEL